MPPTKKTFETIIAKKQRDAARQHAVETLREGTKKSMSVADFVGAVSSVRDLRAAADDVSLADVFTGVIAADAPVRGERRGAGRVAKKKTTRKAAKKKARKKTAKKKARKKAAKKTTRKKVAKRSRADSETVAKRLDAIVAVLKRNGGWMKTADIFAALDRRAALFRGVEINLVSQYLVRLLGEKPARVTKKGNRGASVYSAIGRGRGASKKKATKKKAKRKVTKKKASKKKGGQKKATGKRGKAASKKKTAKKKTSKKAKSKAG